MQPPVGPWLETSPHEVALSASHPLFQTWKSERHNTVINMKHNIMNQITFWQEGLKTEQWHYQNTWSDMTLRNFKPVYIFTAYFHKIIWILLSNLLLCLELNYFPEVLLIRILYTYYFPQLSTWPPHCHTFIWPETRTNHEIHYYIIFSVPAFVISPVLDKQTFYSKVF